MLNKMVLKKAKIIPDVLIKNFELLQVSKDVKNIMESKCSLAFIERNISFNINCGTWIPSETFSEVKQILRFFMISLSR